MVNNDSNFKSIELLRCWCMKSLPTVFSDALSYNQQVCLLTKAINDMANTINGLPDYIIELVKELLNQLNLEEIVKEVLADLYFLNVKNPPNNMTAAVGDGVTDDTVAIQAMIAYLSGKRAYLFFPAGIYSVTGLNVTTKMSLVGFDRYQTTLQLRAGSNKDLLTGDLGACTINDITLDANMPGQTQNCSVFDGNVGNMLVSNVIFKNGYNVLSIAVDGLVQMNNIVFDGVQGNGLSIGGDRVVINDIQFVNNSTLNAGTLITVSSTNSMITGLLNTGGCTTGLNVSGNNNVIIGVIRGATTPIVNTGTDNYIDIIGSVHTVIDGAYTHTMNGDYTASMKSKHETISSHKTETIGGNNLETITGTNIISSGNKTETITGSSSKTVTTNDTETITGTKEIQANDIFLNPTTPLKYSLPIKINDSFSYIPMTGTDGNEYKVLVDTGGSEETPSGTDYTVINNSNGAVNKLLQCAMSYYLRNDLVYGNFKGAYNTECTPVNGRWEIDCSTFTQLCLSGVPFDNSRYNGNGTNVETSGYKFKDFSDYIDPGVDRPYGMLANQEARYAYDNGLLYEIGGDITRIKSGDILYVCNSPEEAYWRRIGHCAIVIEVNTNNSLITCISAGQTGNDPVQLERWNVNNPQVLYCARFPLADCSFSLNDLFNTGYNSPFNTNVNIPAGNTTFVLANILTKSPLESGKFYTLSFKATGVINPMYFTLWGTIGGSLGNITTFGGINGQEYFFVPFYVPKNYSPTVTGNLYSFQLRASVPSGTGTFTTTLSFSDIHFYEGFVRPLLVPNESLNPEIVDVNKPMTTTTYNSEAAMNEGLNNLATSNINFTEYEFMFKASNTTSIEPGRYLLKGFSYSNGTYGSQLLVNIGGKFNAYFRFCTNSVWTVKEIAYKEVTA